MSWPRFGTHGGLPPGARESYNRGGPTTEGELLALPERKSVTVTVLFAREVTVTCAPGRKSMELSAGSLPRESSLGDVVLCHLSFIPFLRGTTGLEPATTLLRVEVSVTCAPARTLWSFRCIPERNQPRTCSYQCLTSWATPPRWGRRQDSNLHHLVPLEVSETCAPGSVAGRVPVPVFRPAS